MKKSTASLVLILILVFTAAASPSGIAGTWRGESICTIRDSPCHDEKVIYHISEPDQSGDLKLRADKVVNGQPEDMGTLDCNFDSKARKLICKMTNGTWEFAVTGTTMKGTLKLSDGRLYRNINVTKD